MAVHNTAVAQAEERGGPLKGLVAVGKGDNIKTLPAGVVSALPHLVMMLARMLLLDCCHCWALDQ